MHWSPRLFADDYLLRHEPPPSLGLKEHEFYASHIDAFGIQKLSSLSDLRSGFLTYNHDALVFVKRNGIGLAQIEMLPMVFSKVKRLVVHVSAGNCFQLIGIESLNKCGILQGLCNGVARRLRPL